MKLSRALPKEKLQRVVLVGMMTLIGVVAAWILYGSKQLAVLNEHRLKVAKLKEDVANAQRSAQAMVQTMPLREKMRAFVDSQRITMVSGDPFAWVVGNVMVLAESQPVRDINMRPGNMMPHPRKDRYGWYVMRIEFVGSYDQIGAFVQELENKFPEAEVRSLDIAGSDGTETGLRATIDLALMVRPELDSEKTAAKPNAKPKAKA